MNRLNIIIDFNNLLMRSITTPGMTFYNSNFDDENDLNDIVKKLTIDICYNIRLFSPNKVIIACDAHNAWRKDILPKDSTGYKANRIKDDTKNWNNLWDKISKFKAYLSKYGFIVSEVLRAEADDLAALWKDELFVNKGESVIMISSDRDWCQLADFNIDNKSFVGIFNPTVNNKGQKKLYLTNETLAYLNGTIEQDNISAIFNCNDNYIKDLINNVINTDRKINIENVDPFNVLMSKIFEGDDGDNVPSFYEYYKTTPKGTRLARVTKTVTQKLKESLKINNIDDLVDASKYIVHQLEKIMKVETIPIDSQERLNRQRILVELNKSLFPDNIISGFNENVIMFEGKTMPVNLTNIKWTNVLNNTEFFNKEAYKKPKEDNVFNDLGGYFSKYFKGVF